MRKNNICFITTPRGPYVTCPSSLTVLMVVATFMVPLSAVNTANANYY